MAALLAAGFELNRGGFVRHLEGLPVPTLRSMLILKTEVEIRDQMSDCHL